MGESAGNQVRPDCVPIRQLMELVLAGKSDPAKRLQLKAHLEGCRECWDAWNLARWRVSEGSVDLSELRLYLGDEFVHGLDSSWLLAAEWNQASRTDATSIESFYEETQWYVYNQVIFAASGQRPNYVDVGLEVMRDHGIGSVLDFGCGVGTDGIRFVEKGLDVGFYDLNSACLSFLRWRLAYRGLSARVFNPTDNPSGYEAVWLMDVIEHLYEPARTLAEHIRGARVVLIDTDSDTTAGGRHPFHFAESMSAAGSFLSGSGFEVRMHDRLQIWSRSA